MEGKWTLGVLIGLPVTVLIILGCLGMIALGIKLWNDDGPPLVMGGFVALVITVVLAGWLFWPWQARFHRWEPVSGTVATISDRLVPAGSNGMEQKFVITYEGGAQEYGCLDTRCALIEPGDPLTLMCLPVWQYAGVDGYDCEWGQEAAS